MSFLQFTSKNLTSLCHDRLKLIYNRELGASQDDLKVASEQLSTRVEAETRELKNINQMLMLELQQKEQDLANVYIARTIYIGMVV